MCRRYYYRLLYFIKKRTRGNAALAEDLCQQVFLKGLQKLRNREIRDPACLATYLHGIAVNDIMNQGRRAAIEAMDADVRLIEAVADDSVGPLESLADHEVQHEVLECLEELSRSDRDVLIRVYLREEDRASICASEGYSPSQLNNIVWRAKERLKARLLQRAFGVRA